MPPDVVNTSGEKEPCSISLTRSSFVLLFSNSFPSRSVTQSQGSVAIALHERIEHPYTTKCTLPTSPPETLCHNVQSCTIFSVCCPVWPGKTDHMSWHIWTLGGYVEECHIHRKKVSKCVLQIATTEHARLAVLVTFLRFRKLSHSCAATEGMCPDNCWGKKAWVRG